MRQKEFPLLATDSEEAFFHVSYIEAWALLNSASLRADLYECLNWQFDRGPCSGHTNGLCLAWQICDLSDRIQNDCFQWGVTRQNDCDGRWESNYKGDSHAAFYELFAGSRGDGGEASLRTSD